MDSLCYFFELMCSKLSQVIKLKKKKKEEEVVAATETSLPQACYLGLVNLDKSGSLPGLSNEDD